MLLPLVVFSQDKLRYYIELEQSIDLGVIQKVINPNETITITTNSNDFSNLINSKSAYEFKKVFPTSITPRLQRVYLLTLDANTQIDNFINRYDIERFFLIEEESILLNENAAPIFYPNDYEDIITGGNNTSLDLINAPLAWTITTGDPNVLNNNNIAWKNTTVVDVIPDFGTLTAIGGVVAVGNPFSEQRVFTN